MESITQPVDQSGLERQDMSQSPPETRLLQRPLVRTGLLLLVTTAYLFPFTHVLRPVGDDGTILYGAQRVSEGAVFGRDFVEVMGPGSFYWLGLFFKLFGAGWQVTRLYLLFTGVATTGLLYVIARQVCRESAALLLWLFVLVMGLPLWPVVSHHWDSNLVAVLALWCYLKLEKTEHPAWAVAAGSLAGITTCFVQPKGLFLLLGFAASALLRRLWLRSGALSIGSRHVDWAPLWLIFGSYGAVGLAVLGAFWRAGALRDLLYANVVWPLSTYQDINAVPYGFGMMASAVLPSLQIFGANRAVPGLICAGLSLIPFLMLAMLPLLSAGPVFASLFFKDRLTRWSPCLAVMLAGAGLWLSEMHRKDIVHLASGAPVLLVALLGSAQLISIARVRSVLMGALVAGLAVFGILNTVSHLQGSHAVETRRGTVVTSMDDQALRFLNTSVKEREYVFVYPYSPLYYYLADVRNPTRFSLLLYGYNTPGQFDEVIRDLDDKRVRYVLWDTEAYGDKLRQWHPGYRHPDADKLMLEQYLGKRYEATEVIGGFRLLRRRADETDNGAPDAASTVSGDTSR